MHFWKQGTDGKLLRIVKSNLRIFQTSISVKLLIRPVHFNDILMIDW